MWAPAAPRSVAGVVDTRHGNGELLRHVVGSLARGRGRDLCGLGLAIGVRWHQPGRNLVAGDYVGCEEVVSSLFGRLRSLTDNSYAILAWTAVTSDGERAVGEYIVSARRAGRDLLSRDVCVIEVRDGSVVVARVYHGDQAAWDRFWS